jgi:hypothetical protein
MPDEIIAKKSKLRREIEEMLRERHITIEDRISVVDLDSGETRYFDNYPQAMEFMRGRKGRWYIATSARKPPENVSEEDLPESPSASGEK